MTKKKKLYARTITPGTESLYSGLMAKTKRQASRLSDDEKLFVMEYFTNGYSVKGASEACGIEYAEGQRLMGLAGIKRAIEQRKKRVIRRLEITQDRIIEEIANIAFFDVLDLYDDEGSLRPLHDIPEHARRALADIEMGKAEKDTKARVSKFRANSKEKALELLGKHLKMFTDKVEHSGKVDHEVRVSKVDIDERVAQLLGKKESGE